MSGQRLSKMTMRMISVVLTFTMLFTGSDVSALAAVPEEEYETDFQTATGNDDEPDYFDHIEDEVDNDSSSILIQNEDIIPEQLSDDQENPFSGGSGNPDDPFLISNVDQLKLIEEGGYGSEFKLISDLTLKNWSPLNCEGVNFDGGGHTIHNLTITQNESDENAIIDSIALFREVRSIKNLTIENAEISNYKDNFASVSVFAGRAWNVDNCCLKGEVVLRGKAESAGFVMMLMDSMSNCTNEAKITVERTKENASLSFGGFVHQMGLGYNSPVLENLVNAKGSSISCEGLAAGILNGSGKRGPSLKNCINYADITGTEASGIVRLCSLAMTISDCHNYGTIHSTVYGAAGVVGYCKGGSCTVTGCSNAGDIISDTGSASGIICADDDVPVIVEDSYNRGTITGESVAGIIVACDMACTRIARCYNRGTLIAGNSGPVPNVCFAGGIIGQSYSSIYTPYHQVPEGIDFCVIEDCYNGGDINKRNDVTIYAGGIIGAQSVGKIKEGENYKLTNCYNKVSFKKFDSDKDKAGSLIGEFSANTDYKFLTENCYCLDPACGYTYADDNYMSEAFKGVTICTTAQLKEQTTYSGFDFDKVWTMGEARYPYPVLTGKDSGGSGNTETGTLKGCSDFKMGSDTFSFDDVNNRTKDYWNYDLLNDSKLMKNYSKEMKSLIKDNSENGGWCFGLAIVTGLMYLGIYDPGDYGASEVAALEHSGGLDALITYYFMIQKTYEVRSEMKYLNPGDEYGKKIISILDNSKPCLVEFGMTESDNVSHAVLAYAYDDSTDSDNYLVYFMDPSRLVLKYGSKTVYIKEPSVLYLNKKDYSFNKVIQSKVENIEVPSSFKSITGACYVDEIYKIASDLGDNNKIMASTNIKNFAIHSVNGGEVKKEGPFLINRSEDDGADYYITEMLDYYLSEEQGYKVDNTDEQPGEFSISFPSSNLMESVNTNAKEFYFFDSGQVSIEGATGVSELTTTIISEADPENNKEISIRTEAPDLTVSIEKGACSLESSGPIGEVVLKVDGGEEVTVDVKESKETVDVSKMNMDSDTVRCVVRQKVDLNGTFNTRFGKTYGKYLASENGYVGINGKGILTPKKAGTVKIFGCEKNSGTKKWEAVGEPITVYIEMPAKVKGNIVSNRHLETMNALEILGNGTIKPDDWINSKPDVAELDKTSGMLTILSNGATKITAVYGTGKNAAKYTFNVKVNGPVISKSKVTMLTGAVLKLKLNKTEEKPVWTSSDPEAVSVDPETGEVTALLANDKMSPVIITAKLGEAEYNSLITVKQPVIAKKELKITKEKGGKVSLKNTKLKSVEWYSQNPEIATVDKSTGVVSVGTDAKPGDTTVVYTNSGGIYCGCTITVK